MRTRRVGQPCGGRSTLLPVNKNNLTVKKLLFLLFISTSLTLFAQKPKIEQALDSLEIVLGDQCHLFLSVTAKNGADVMFPDFSQTHAIAPGVEVVEQMYGDSVQNNDGTLKQTIVYTLTSFEPKLHYIQPLTVLVDGKKIVGKQLALKVIDVPVDTTKLDQFFPPKDIQTNPFSFDEWKPLILLHTVTSVLLVLAMLCHLLRRGNKPIRISFRIIKRIPAHVKAMSAIDEIKNGRIPVEGDQKEYYTRLTDALRIYLEERFGFSAMEMTTREIIERLQSEDPIKVAELREVFETADLVKFAKYSTLVNENDRNLVTAIDFINSTKTEEVVEERREEETLTEEQRQTNVTLKALRWLQRIAAVAAILLFAYTIWQIVQLIE